MLNNDKKPHLIKSFGNSKLPSDTLIISMSSHKECAMKSACPFGDSEDAKYRGKCYSKKPEVQYENVRNSRAQQTEYWRSTSNEQKLIDFANLWKKHPRKMPTIKAVRFNESGDMRDYNDLMLLMNLASMYSGIEFYLYTHNEQLMDPVSILDLPDNLTINLSYRHNKPGFNTFVPIEDYKDGEDYIVCPGNCKTCSLCLEAKELNIGVEIH